jgi:Asp-tRNA(Asn)/Glu-tRNA(Gln) amidotransferase A subunit family amidase
MDPLSTGIDFFSMLKSINSGGGERREALEVYLGGRESPVHNLQELFDTGAYLPKLKAGYARALKAPPLYENDKYAAFMRNRAAFTQVMLDVMKQYDLDAIIYPYQTKPAYTIEEAQDPDADNYNVLGRGTRMSTVTGFPAITVPAGFTSDGMPVGLEFLGRPFTEGTLISMTYAYEQASHNRKPPATTPPLAGAPVVTVAARQLP